MKWKTWEIALALAFLLCAVYIAVTAAAQERLAGKLLRLRVIAASDDPADQEAKLAVRDAVLAELAPRLADAENEARAEALAREALTELESLARAVLADRGLDTPVTVTLDRETCPTRDYDTFSLPAGEYRTLRVVLGEGKGENWWCVVYPSLCTDPAETWGSESDLTEQETALLTRPKSYVIRFRVLELLARLRARLKQGKTGV